MILNLVQSAFEIGSIIKKSDPGEVIYD